MIWIATILLVVVAGYLVRQAIDEKRWFDVHVDTDTKLADRGLMGWATDLVSPRPAEAENALSAEYSRYTLAMKRVGNKLNQLDAPTARQTAGGQTTGKGNSETIFGRTISQLKGSAENRNAQLSSKLQSTSAALDRAIADESSVVGRAAAAVRNRTRASDKKIKSKAKKPIAKSTT